MARICIAACGIFQEEVEWLIKEEGLNGIELKWLPVGLHDDIEKLENALTGEVAERELKQEGVPLGLMFGWGCLPWMRDFAKEKNVPVLNVKNCLAAMVGDEELKELEKNRTLVATPGWVRKMWLGRAGTPEGWRVDDYRIQFGRYDLILVLDPGLNPLSDEEIITCFDLVQVPLEVRPCDLGHFRETFLEFVKKINYRVGQNLA